LDATRKVTAQEIRLLDAALVTVRLEAIRMLERAGPIIAPGDLEGDLLHASAHIMAAFTRRTHSKLTPETTE